MSIASELYGLMTELNNGRKVGTLHFIGGTGLNGYGNWAKAFYDTQFIPHLNYFRKPLQPTPRLLRDRPRIINPNILIKNTERVGEESVSGYVNWDSFLDDSKIMSFDFTKPNPQENYNFERLGYLIMDDPFLKKDNTVNPSNLMVLKQGHDLASILLNLIGVCPRINPLLKRLAGLELAKELKNKGLKIVQDGNYLYMETPKEVSGFLGNMIKKATRAMKDVGKKIQKGLLDPVREMMKSKIPAVWDVIDKFDKSSGFTKTLKKFSKQVEDVVDKYGEKIANMALMGAAAIVGGPQGSAAAGMLLKVADNLSQKEKKTLQKVVDSSGQIEKVDKDELKNITTSIFTNLKDQMVGLKGKEGKDDFMSILNFAREAITETEKQKEKTEEVVKGIKIHVMPLTQYTSFVSGTMLKVIK